MDDHVQVVGGLVQEQHVGVGHQDFGQVEPDLKATGELHGVSLHVFGGEAEAGQHLFHPPGVIALLGGQSQAALGQDGVLGEFEALGQVADPVGLGHQNFTRIRRFQAQDDPEQRGFAMAVPAHQANPFVPVDGQGHVVENHLGTKGLGKIDYPNHVVANMILDQPTHRQIPAQTIPPQEYLVRIGCWVVWSSDNG